ncbi:MAG: hypothetical protein AAF355_10335 [Myxococcota bacterium]
MSSIPSAFLRSLFFWSMAAQAWSSPGSVDLAHAHEIDHRAHELHRVSAEGVLILHGSFGLLVSEDHGNVWQWICPEAIDGFINGRLATTALLDDGSLWMDSTFGLYKSAALGCDFAADELGSVTTHVQRIDSDTVWVASASFGEENHVHGLSTSGTVWKIAPVLPTDFAALRFAFHAPAAVPEGPSISVPNSVFVGGMLGAAPALLSFDRPQLDPPTSDHNSSESPEGTWSSVAVPPVPEANHRLYLLGIDALDRVWVRYRLGDRDLVYFSDDAAFQSDPGWVLAADLSSEPGTANRAFAFAESEFGIFFGNRTEGLFFFDHVDSVVASLNAEIKVSCAMVQEEELWLCVDPIEQGHLLLRTSVRDPWGKPPVRQLFVDQIAGVRSCGGRVERICDRALFEDLILDLGGSLEDGPDATSPPNVNNEDATDSVVAGEGSVGGEGCAAAGKGAGLSPPWLCLAMIFVPRVRPVSKGLRSG